MLKKIMILEPLSAGWVDIEQVHYYFLTIYIILEALTSSSLAQFKITEFKFGEKKSA